MLFVEGTAARVEGSDGDAREVALPQTTQGSHSVSEITTSQDTQVDSNYMCLLEKGQL